MQSTSKLLNLRHQPICREKLSSHKDLQKLWVGPSHGMDVAIIDSLPESLQHLDWDMTGGISEQYDALQALLKRSLRHLCLRFRGDEVALVLSQHLATDLESLDLRGNQIGNQGTLALLCAICVHCPSLRSLNLAYNRIGDEGVKGLARLLEDPSCQLEYLNLSANVFGEESALCLVKALSVNRSLKELSLFGNQITTNVCHALVESLHCNFTLEHVNLGAIMTDNAFSKEQMEIEYLLKLNRGGRRLLRNVDVPPALWPQILTRSSDPDLIFSFLSEKPDLVAY